MAYELTWYARDEVLYLGMEGNLSIEELKAINEEMMAILDSTPRKLNLMIEVSALTAGYSTVDSLRSTQKYRDHLKLDSIIGIANNKLNRLITLLAFNLCRADFVQFDSRDKAELYLSEKGIAASSRLTNPTRSDN
jgi:hypothetical protein